MSPQLLPRKQLYTQFQTRQLYKKFLCVSWWAQLSKNIKNKALPTTLESEIITKYRGLMYMPVKYKIRQEKEMLQRI